MVYLEINKNNYLNGNPSLIEKLNKYLTNKYNKIFILIYMEGCGPCNETRPEWSKLKNVLSNDFLKKEDIILVSIDKDLFGKLKNVGNEPTGFPTIRFITDVGRKTQTYEDSEISNKDRRIDSFVEWIKLKSGEKNITMSEIPSTSLQKKSKHLKKRHYFKKTRKQIAGKKNAGKKNARKQITRYKRT
jgi:thiol-disulfide isomerase/thioredoxin